jgi:eukaryotic-like serine/threonine-protein kinase
VPLPPVIGSYQPLLELASGGMATVYAVRLVGARGFERIVVMKRVHPHLLGNREFREMFLDEARISSLVRHSNIVHVLDVIEESGELFLIMEYVESVSLAQLIKTLDGAQLPPPIVSRIVCDVLAGLHAAHEAVDLRGQPMNIVHRDVSPQNIIVGADGTSRLIDFGIAKAASRLTPTTTGMLKGKFGYMAPEQIRQHKLDRRVDVFAAGVVLHEALVSARLFAGGDEADALLSVLVRDVPPPSSLVLGLPLGVDAVVARALARDRDERFSTATEFAAALEQACPPASAREVATLLGEVCADALDDRRRKLHAALDAIGPASPVQTPPSTPVEMSHQVPIAGAEGRRRRGVLAAAFVLATLAAAVVVFALTRSSTIEKVAPADPTPTASEPATAPPPVDSVSVPAAPPSAVTRGPTPIPAKRSRPQGPKELEIHAKNPYVDGGKG